MLTLSNSQCRSTGLQRSPCLGLVGLVLASDVVLESDLSTYFEDSDSNPLDSDLDSSPWTRTRTQTRTRTPGLGWTRGVQELDSALYDLELINYLYFIC